VGEGVFGKTLDDYGENWRVDAWIAEEQPANMPAFSFWNPLYLLALRKMGLSFLLIYCTVFLRAHS